MGYAAFLGLRAFAVIFPLYRVWGIFMQGLCAGLVGLIVGIAVLVLLKNKELEEVWCTLHQKIWKVPVPPAQTDRM